MLSVMLAALTGEKSLSWTDGTKQCELGPRFWERQKQEFLPQATGAQPIQG